VASVDNVVILSGSGMTMTLRRGIGNPVGSALAKIMSPVRDQTRGVTAGDKREGRRGSGGGGLGEGREGAAPGAWALDAGGEEGGLPSPRADVEGVRLGGITPSAEGGVVAA
jgi:hypothetical protein